MVHRTSFRKVLYRKEGKRVTSVGKPDIHYLCKMIKVSINRGESF